MAGIACLVSFAAMLAACSKTPEPEAQPAEEAVPVGRLGNEVAPQHYRLELRIDPREERFSGKVEIDVVLDDDLDRFWLHGKNLDVSEAWVLDSNGDRIDATYEERDVTGVALVSLASPAQAGPASLHFTWSATFNPSVNALYTVTRDEDHYAATQFQPIGARQVFPGFDEPAFKVPFDLALVVRDGDTAITTTPEAEVEKLDDGMVMYTQKRGFVRALDVDSVSKAFETLFAAVKSSSQRPPDTCRTCGSGDSTGVRLLNGVVDRV